MVRIAMFVVWTGLLVYSFLLAPGAKGGADQTMIELLTLQEQEPTLMAVFSLMGVWPAVFACLLLRNDRASIPAWPFVLASFALGGFALLPYFIFSSLSSSRTNRTPRMIRHIVASKITYAVLAILSLLLFVQASQGNFAVYLEVFRSSQFVHTMTIDFALLPFLAVYAIYREQKNNAAVKSFRIYTPRRFPAILGMIPLIGTLAYLWVINAAQRRPLS